MNTEITNYSSKKEPTIDKIRELWKDNAKKMVYPENMEARVVDQYGREELDAHLQRFVQHCAAKGIQPTMATVIDWLYSHKAFNERDDFVKIEKLMELVGKGQVYPLLIMEVLDYARKVENAAIEVYDELGHLDEHFESLQHLKKALDIRLKVREDDKKKKTDDNGNFVTDFVNKLKNG